MDLEAVQLLNLSPIPELSELELSTMLEQLSGLSDLNGDLTDRNVEDILKEAENLIDTSLSSKINELPVSNIIAEQDKQNQYFQIKSQKVNEAQESFSEGKNSSSPVENITPKSSPTKTHESNKHYNSPVEQSNKIFLSGDSSNPIKSTIDSLKEFSTLVEKHLNSKLTSNTQNHNYCEEKEEKEKSLNKSPERINSPKAVLKNEKQKNNLCVRKNSEQIKVNKSSKLLNCFERLYQERPNRLSKQQKVLDKIPKTVIKKKHLQNLKSSINTPNRPTLIKNNSEELKNKINKGISEDFLPKSCSDVENWLKNSNPKCCNQSDDIFDIFSKKVDESENELVLHKSKNSVSDFRMNDSCKAPSQLNEKLILKLLEEVEEIKDHVKKTGIIKNEVPEKIIQESQAVIDNLRSEVESVKEKVVLESMRNTGLERLEEQFAVLKDKYDQHMKKLEEENLKLREALGEKYNTLGRTCFEPAEIEPSRESKISLPSVQSSFNTGRKIVRSFSTETCWAPRNSPCSSLEDIRPSFRKEAFSQTEKDVRSMSVQCLEEPKSQFEEVTIEEDDLRKSENKENVGGKKKVGKERFFSEKNSHQLLKQKKIVSSHESQLLATLRGLQTEITAKEKENRKLKTEIDLLKSQLKKPGKRIESTKKRHIGTQTIGLGPLPQKPYNPQVYEISGELETENEDLKSKIKSLEEDFKVLKEKRVNDLQSLHLIHEEEMAKLLSKLETQSALTKHLHSLLVNR